MLEIGKFVGNSVLIDKCQASIDKNGQHLEILFRIFVIVT